MTINELNTLIIEWAKERELDTKGTVEAQSIKTVEELSELIKAICKDNKEDIIDSIGDVYVTLVIGNMLDSNWNLDKVHESMEICFNEKVIENCKTLNKISILDKLATRIEQILGLKYVPSLLYDITRNLIEIAHNYDLDFVDCVESAYNTIKDRHGKLVDGMYIKDEDLADAVIKEFDNEFANAIAKGITDSFANDLY